jgi:hypothetical protein
MNARLCGRLPVADIKDSPLLLTTNSDFHISRFHGRQTIPLVTPWLAWMLQFLEK